MGCKKEKRKSKCNDEVLDPRNQIVSSEIEIAIRDVIGSTDALGWEAEEVQTLAPESQNNGGVLVLDELRHEYSLGEKDHPVGEFRVKELKLRDKSEVKGVEVFVVEIMEDLA